MKKAALAWNIRQVVKMVDKGTINFDLSIQRNRVWDEKRESLLIDSVLREYPIPAIFTSKSEGVYDVLDGKQRILTFNRFLKNEFTLVGLDDIETEGQTYSINGLTFEQLPEELRDAITSYTLTIYYLDDATEEEINQVFVRLNNGMPLTKFELTRAKASSNLMPTITNITEHEVFSKFAISEKQLLRYTDQEIALQMLITCFDKEPSFVGDYMQNWAEQFRITDEQQNKITEILDTFNYISQYANEKAIKKAFKKVHISGLTYLINKYGKDNSSDYITLVNEFFAGKSVPSEEYSRNSKAGSAKPDSIKKRFEAIDEYFQKILEENNRKLAKVYHIG